MIGMSDENIPDKDDRQATEGIAWRPPALPNHLADE
jgi:hypothetical protein